MTHSLPPPRGLRTTRKGDVACTGQAQGSESGKRQGDPEGRESRDRDQGQQESTKQGQARAGKGRQGHHQQGQDRQGKGRRAGREWTQGHLFKEKLRPKHPPPSKGSPPDRKTPGSEISIPHPHPLHAKIQDPQKNTQKIPKNPTHMTTLLDSQKTQIRVGDYIREIGEFADTRKFKIVEYTRIGVMNEDGNIVTNFPLNQENMDHYRIDCQNS